MKKAPSDLHKGREAIEWTGCPTCGRAKVKHYAKGMCSVCYRRA